MTNLTPEKIAELERLERMIPDAPWYGDDGPIFGARENNYYPGEELARGFDPDTGEFVATLRNNSAALIAMARESLVAGALSDGNTAATVALHHQRERAEKAEAEALHFAQGRDLAEAERDALTKRVSELHEVAEKMANVLLRSALHRSEAEYVLREVINRSEDSDGQ